MNIVTMVGSVRKESYNRHIAHFMKNRYKNRLNISILEIGDLPFFDQDVEENPPEVVKRFKSQVKDADGVLIVTPEYVHSVPGILKNALDWLSRVDHVMHGKPTLLVGASTGMLGTVRCQIHLRQICAAPGITARVLPGNEVFINMVHEKVDERGNLNDQGTIDFLDQVVDHFIEFSTKN